RAFSEDWQYHVFKRLKDEAPEGMVSGSSNVHCAMVNDSVPQGTMAHQWMMAYQAFYPLHISQRKSWEDWIEEWRGKNGLALS
ncbi:beta/alpha barrel domain-containing protein, partial [Streptomyces galilaeus]|uniref:hypothetical protein n=1 Tax=Streptomyces galilaeus TaxID=33899 RepID=UPI0038F7CB42